LWVVFFLAEKAAPNRLEHSEGHTNRQLRCMPSQRWSEIHTTPSRSFSRAVGSYVMICGYPEHECKRVDPSASAGAKRRTLSHHIHEMLELSVVFLS